LDTTLTTTHTGENNQTHIRNRNLLTGSAHAIFQGKFYVAQAAQKTNAYMHCHNLLLSDTARTSHKPELEIYADDVKCSHGAATGGLNPLQLFYLQARGLNPQAARALLVQGYADEFIQQFPTHLHQQLNQTLHHWLHGTPEEPKIDFGTLQGEWLNDNPVPFKVIQGTPADE
ncbi:MAG: SufD family Fe-S cluster assembly protein, partial [Proteobacteria bacterium]|nr:SufD family Fe-S cluster assembly protein [Pseudomonadota bacterium]